MKARISKNKGLPCKCTNCHRHFTIPARDLEYYRLNRQVAPRTCPVCRRLRRVVKLSRDGKGCLRISIKGVKE